MQIHELNTFSGTPTETDYLAIDNGSETNKVPATSLGVSTQMTLPEAKVGTVTDPRVVSPSIFKSSVEWIAGQVCDVLVRKFLSISSLPQTYTYEKFTSDMVVIKAELSNPSAQTSDWTVTTYDGSLKIEGNISGSTTLTLYLMKSRA